MHITKGTSSQKLNFHPDFYPGNSKISQIGDGNMMFRLDGIASAKRTTVTHRITSKFFNENFWSNENCPHNFDIQI